MDSLDRLLDTTEEVDLLKNGAVEYTAEVVVVSPTAAAIVQASRACDAPEDAKVEIGVRGNPMSLYNDWVVKFTWKTNR
jgi:hypothetical protein